MNKLDCRQLYSWQKIVFVKKKKCQFSEFLFVSFSWVSWKLFTEYMHHSCLKANSGGKDYIIGAVTHTMVKWILLVDEAVVNFNGE